MPILKDIMLEHSEEICQLLKQIEVEWVRCHGQAEVRHGAEEDCPAESSCTKLSSLFVNLVASYVEESKSQQNVVPSQKLLKICQLIAKLASDSHIKTVKIPFILLESMVELVRYCQTARPIKDIFIFMTLCCQNQQFAIIDRSHCLDVILNIAVNWIKHDKVDLMAIELTTLLQSYCSEKTSHGTNFNYEQATKILDIAIYFIKHKYHAYVYQLRLVVPLDHSIQIMHNLIDNDRCSPNKISYPLLQLTQILMSQHFSNHTKIAILMIIDEVIQQSSQLSVFLIEKCHLLTVFENMGEGGSPAVSTVGQPVTLRFWHQLTELTSYRGNIPNYVLHNNDYEQAQITRQRLNV